MKINLNDIIKNITLVLFSVFITVLMAEFILRQTEIGHYSVNDRILFYSQKSFEVGEYESVKYAENSKIRSVAIYGNYIDYDVTYDTNNLGFIDNIPYNSSSFKKKNIIFLGDSFTAGSGSNNPWVNQVRESHGSSDVEVYNLGVSGTGIIHFYNLLKSLKSILPLEEINIVVISNDFFRSLWYPHVKSEGVWFCKKGPKENCPNSKKPIIYITDHNESKESLLVRADDIYKSKRKRADGSLAFHQQLRLYNLFCDVYGANYHTKLSKSICPHLGVFQTIEYSKGKSYANSIEILTTMLTEFPGVKFRLFHMPEKSEVYSGQYYIDVKNDMNKIGLNYIPLLNVCNWDTSMYYKHDAHPNDKGYSNLANCILKNLIFD